MSRGRIYIESRMNEGGRSCQEMAAMALQALMNALDFIRSAAFTEGRAENPKCRALLAELAKYSRSKSNLCELSSTASTIFGVKTTKMREILREFEADGDGAYDKALRAVKKSSPGSTEGQRLFGPLPSCYFDPSNIVRKSDYSMGAPFYNLPLNDVTWNVVRWLGYVAKLRDYRLSPLASNLDFQVELNWFQATVADALIRLPNERNEKDVWQVLESIGLNFSDKMKGAIIKHLKGDTSTFDAWKHDQNKWYFNQNECDDAKKRWADKWADQFARELNNTEQGIVSYGENEIDQPGFGAGLSDVERWIQQNTVYGVHQREKQSLGPHGDFMRGVEVYCRYSWYRDISLALRRFRRSARVSLEEISRSSPWQITSLIQAGTQTCYQNLASDLRNLGLVFTKPVKALIFKNLREDGQDGLTSLQQHGFGLKRAVVVQHAAEQIKAALSLPNRSVNRKRSHN